MKDHKNHRLFTSFRRGTSNKNSYLTDFTAKSSWMGLTSQSSPNCFKTCISPVQWLLRTSITSKNIKARIVLIKNTTTPTIKTKRSFKVSKTNSTCLFSRSSKVYKLIWTWSTPKFNKNSRIRQEMPIRLKARGICKKI